MFILNIYYTTSKHLQFWKALLRLLEKQNALHSPLFSIFFFIMTFGGILERSEEKVILTANTIQLFVVMKRNFSGQFIF